MITPVLRKLLTGVISCCSSNNWHFSKNNKVAANEYLTPGLNLIYFCCSTRCLQHNNLFCFIVVDQLLVIACRSGKIIRFKVGKIAEKGVFRSGCNNLLIPRPKTQFHLIL